MSQTDFPLAEPKSHGVRPHICCVPPPRAPSSQGRGRNPLLARAETRRGSPRTEQPSACEPRAERQSGSSPQEPSEQSSSEPGGGEGWEGGKGVGGCESGPQLASVQRRWWGRTAAGGGGLTAAPSISSAAPDGGWLSADESSGYESESAGGERSEAEAPCGSRGRQRRARTAFSSEQVCRLEKTFQRQKYLGASERRKLAAALQLSEVQVGARRLAWLR